MKHPSPKTCELLRTLYARQTLWQRVIGWREPPLSEFEEIAKSGDALAIPDLTPFLLHRRNDLSDSAARTIACLIGNLSSEDFASLDEACRNEWSYDSSSLSAWRGLKPDAVKAFWRLPSPAAILGVASFHGSGFVREAAVKELANIFDGPELPFLLVRLNDWVEPVRESAATAVRRRIRPDYASHFFRHLRLVLRLQSCGRAQHQQILAEITALFANPVATPFLREGMQSGDRWLRRESFRIALAADTAQKPALLHEMVVANDPILRLWAVRNVLVRLIDSDLRAVLPTLIQDRFTPVRCEGLNLLARRFPREASNELVQALFDGHASVRALARYWIRTHEPRFDFGSVYRQAINDRSTAKQRAAILGLGETGAPVDTAVVLPFLRVPLVSTRKAAIRALAALNVDHCIDELVGCLRDQHPGISNEAARALTKRANSLVDRLQPLFTSEPHLHVRKNVFRLLALQPFWTRGAFLFEMLRDPHEPIVAQARRTLVDWMNRSRSMATAPASAELRQLRQAISNSAASLPVEQLTEIEFCLKAYE
jgi:HEAT repeat protein